MPIFCLSATQGHEERHDLVQGILRSPRDGRERRQARGFWSNGLLWNVLWPIFFEFPGSCRVLNRSRDGAVDQEGFRILILAERSKNFLENSFFGPAVETSVDRIPRTVTLGHISPRGARAERPERAGE